MKISGGKERGRTLRVPAGARVRPTSDKVKQALFNILGDRVAGATFLDLYAGAGGVGIEALSRNADRVIFVDAADNAVRFIQRNLESTGFCERARVIQADAGKFLKKHQGAYDIIFLDPPYGKELPGRALAALHRTGWIADDAVVIVQHHPKDAFDPPAGGRAGDLQVQRRKTPEGFVTTYSYHRYAPTVIGDAPYQIRLDRDLDVTVTLRVDLQETARAGAGGAPGGAGIAETRTRTREVTT